MNLRKRAQLIKTKNDFAAFLAALRSDLDQNPSRWENTTLETFLAAMESWVIDMHVYYKNSGQATPDPPTWKTFADILLGASVYE